jgi:hypothetical protein
MAGADVRVAAESPAESSKRDWRVRGQLFLSEMTGTALLVTGGLSVVILMNGDASPFLRLIPNTLARLTVTGFLFGSVGAFEIMVPLETPVSGTSTNPARSLGPALISGRREGWWIYWAGPAIGVVVAIVVFAFLARRIEVASWISSSTIAGVCFAGWPDAMHTQAKSKGRRARHGRFLQVVFRAVWHGVRARQPSF